MRSKKLTCFDDVVYSSLLSKLVRRIMHAHMDATSRGIRTKESIGIKIFATYFLVLDFQILKYYTYRCYELILMVSS